MFRLIKSTLFCSGFVQSKFIQQPKPKAVAAATALIVAAIPLIGQTSDFESRIVGGVGVNVSNAPATVALLKKDRYEIGGASLAQFCGGTLINQNWVLSAAHCFSDDGVLTDASEILVLEGTSDLSAELRPPIEVATLVVHESFINVETGNDIALLQLRTSAGSTAAAIDNLPVEFNQIGFIAGWGALDDRVTGQSQRFPNQLQGADVFMIPGQLCDPVFPLNQGQTGQPIFESQVCGYFPGGGIDSCQGDSGGPLYRVSVDSELTLTGIVSYGIGCARVNFPGVYTRVQSFRSWINTVIDNTPAPSVVPSTNNGSSSGGGAGSIWLILSLLGLLVARPLALAFRRQ